MCGIAGFTNPAPDARRILAEMNAALGHRGPDGNGVFVDDNIAMGHTRLASPDALSTRGCAPPEASIIARRV
jgi:asparagine synthase (glutamine-hydrolysing)